MSHDEKFEKLNMEMFQKLMEKNPHYATFFGLHDPYDWMMPDGSSKNVFEGLELAEEWVDRVKKAVKLNELNTDHKIDVKVLEHSYELSNFSVNEHRTWETNPDAFDEMGGVFFVMLTRDYAPIEKRVEAIVARLEKLPVYMREFRTRFEKSKPVKLWTEIALESCQQIPGLFQFIVMATEGAISEELHNRLAKQIAPGKGIKEAMELIEAKTPKTFEEALKATKEAMEKAREFIIQNDLATVYPDDMLHVVETPGFMAPLIPFAALIGAGKFDKRQEGIYVVTRPKEIANLGKHLK